MCGKRLVLTIVAISMQIPSSEFCHDPFRLLGRKLSSVDMCDAFWHLLHPKRGHISKITIMEKITF